MILGRSEEHSPVQTLPASVGSVLTALAAALTTLAETASEGAELADSSSGDQLE